MKKRILASLICVWLLAGLLSGAALTAEGADEAEYTPAGENAATETGRFTDMLQNANTSGGTVKLLQNITFEANTGATITGNDVTLDLNGYEIAGTLTSSIYGTFNSYSGTRPITIQSNGVLMLIDSRAYSDNPGNIKNGVEVKKGGTFTMESGSISNSEGYNGVQNSGTFIMNGGFISNNNHQRIGAFGGGVCNYGTFIMNGGKITNNTNYSYGETLGGGVYSKGSFIMYDGEISGNTLKSYSGWSGNGGGVYIGADGEYTQGELKEFLVFIMSGGTISQNTTEGYGGGVYIVGGGYKNVYSVFNMNGEEISGNASGRSGGGIYIDNNARVNITEGSISNNKTERSGGGIGIYNTFTSGGGWEPYMPGELHLKNVVITGNTAENYVYNETDYGSYGGGVATCPTSATYVYLTDGGAIYGNTSTRGELLAQQVNPDTSHQHLLYLSEYMLGGGAYNWTDLEGTPIEANKFVDLESDDFIATNSIAADSPEAKTANNLAKVFITGNTASYMGGGIMNNGILEIGTSEVSLRVEKQLENSTDFTAEFQFTAEFWTEEQATGEKISYSKQLSYVKTGEEDVTEAVPDSEGKITFELAANEYIVFYGLDDNVHYKVSETLDENYETRTTDNTEGVIQIDEQLENVKNVIFTNTYVKPKTGDLSVSKTVSGNAGDKNRDFIFTVKLENNSVNGTYGDLVFTDGIATFTLKHGEVKTAVGLPVNIRYTVEESDNDGYTVTKSCDTGIIQENKTIEVLFTNTKNSDPVPDPDEPEKPDKPDPDKPDDTKPSDPNTPQTGDEGGMAMWTAAALAGAAGIAAVIISGRKRRVK